MEKQDESLAKLFSKLDDIIRKKAREVHQRNLILQEINRSYDCSIKGVKTGVSIGTIGGAVAGGVVGGPPGAVVGGFFGFIAGGTSGFYVGKKGARWTVSRFKTSKRKEGINSICEQIKENFIKKIQIILEKVILTEGKFEEEIDLILNPSLGKTSEVDVAYVTEIAPLLLSEKLNLEELKKIFGVEQATKLNRETECMTVEDVLMETFGKIEESGKSIRWGKISLSGVELTNERLSNLVAKGLGNSQTRELILSHNPLGEEGLQSLKEYIVASRKFRDLKKLSLRAAKLQHPICLQYIKRIVETVNIEKLDVSDNEQLAGGGSTIESPFPIFLRDLTNNMVSLRKIKLRNIGFQRDHAPYLEAVLKKLSLLRYIDLRNNSNLLYAHYVNNILKGVKENISLNEMRIDGEDRWKEEAALKIREELDRHKDFFNILEKKSDKQPPLIALLNLFEGKSHDNEKITPPPALLQFLGQTQFKWKRVREILKEIHHQRQEIPKEAPVSEQELIACIKKRKVSLFNQSPYER